MSDSEAVFGVRSTEVGPAQGRRSLLALAQGMNSFRDISHNCPQMAIPCSFKSMTARHASRKHQQYCAVSNVAGSVRYTFPHPSLEFVRRNSVI